MAKSNGKKGKKGNKARKGRLKAVRQWRSDAARSAAPTPVETAQAEYASRAEMVPYDDSLLEHARTQWQFGDWESLCQLSRKTLEQHPDRAKLALLAASGHLQCGATTEAHKLLRLADAWGCDRQLIARALIAGVHNSLGRACMAAERNHQALKHFELAISALQPKADARLLGEARAARETIRLGLLPQAARMMSAQLNAVKEKRGASDARIKILETEIELLHHELSLAQQRGQLAHRRNQTQTDTHANVADNANENEIPELKNRSMSQLGQDLWVLERTNFKRGGFFVEFGATDGVLLSNTWLLEKEFEWKGICVEPNPKFFEQLKRNRQCTVSNHYIGGETGKKVEFIMADAYGGSADYASSDMHADKREAYRKSGYVRTVESISLDDVLRELGAPRVIDYMSIDTEGSEWEILRTFPFDKWQVRLLTVEHNFTEHRADIRRLLESRGFVCTEAQWDDWYECLNLEA